ncbi:MAG TPA: prepilin-type N-terminal cleavage/methylation domain-containing protein [bacterium]|nr:prepilin-type N-terminal cleavage/methylation domain-containing protein [bacterium]HOL48732.1 prepilin-type N-terminal cleavage/methylation domain-containing protein [bacterium]HPQ20056.1 prepilin-type N-terminal cleavage/methylation domain-containing protein [bacterium]
MKIKNNKGFTLIEVLVSIAVIGIISTALTSLLQAVLKSWTRGSKKVEILQNTRDSIESLTNEIKCVIPAYNGNIYIDLFVFNSEENVMMIGSSKVTNTWGDRLNVVSAANRATTCRDGYNIVEFYFFLGDATGITNKALFGNPRQIEIDLGNSNHLYLIRNPEDIIIEDGSTYPPNEVTPWTSANDLAGRVLGTNVTSFKVSFCDTDLTWVTVWSTTKKYLPKAVKIIITGTPDRVDDNLKQIYGDPTVAGSGDTYSITLRLFQENVPYNWY